MHFKHGLVIVSCCLLTQACSLIPPTPSGRVLLKGQSKSQANWPWRQTLDQAEAVSIRNGVESRSTKSIVDPGIIPINPGFEFENGLNAWGTQWGIGINMWLEGNLSLRQAIYRSPDPEAWALALQAEAVGSPTGDFGLSGSLAATRDWGEICDTSIALRGGHYTHTIWGPGSWGPSTVGRFSSPFVDAVAVLGLGSSLDPTRFKIELLYRHPLLAQVAGPSSTYTQTYAPYDSYTYYTEMRPGPWICARLVIETLNFTPYAAWLYAAPKKWTPRRSPDNASKAQHLVMALDLERSGMPVDAADEYQEVLRQDPLHVESHLALTRIYLILEEIEMAYFHACRAASLAPQDKRAQAAKIEARQARKAKP